MHEFTNPQIAAINSTSPDIAVVAGPGSGKTTVLAHRLRAMMVTKGFAARDMIVISFTNAAANEIVARLKKVGEPGLDHGPEPLRYAGTLHGWALRLLKESGHLINLPKQISMLTEEDAKQLRDSIIDGQKVKCAMKDIDAALALGPGFYLNEAPERLSPQMVVAAAYYRTLLESGVMDFDSLLKFAILVLEKMHISGGPSGIAKIVCLFWDEAQDSGGDDWRIMELIGAENRFVVGDPDQSIYAFRGARPDLFNEYLRKPGREVIKLEENFRCGPSICKAANSLIHWNRGRFEKRTRSLVANIEDEVIVSESHDPGQELEAIAREIRRFKNLNEVAVLCRFNKTVEKLGLGLAGFGIPVAVAAKPERPVDWPLARAYISLLSNPRNDVLMYWWLVRINGKKGADAIRLHSMRERKPIVTMLERQHLFPDNPTPDKLPGLLAAQEIGQESIVAVQKAAASLPPGATLAELAFALADEEIHRKETGEGVTVTTIHSAKGREWDVVILPAFEQGIIPSLSKTANIEEERRVAFVGITRARFNLIVTNARNREPMYGRGPLQPTAISQFAAEARLTQICRGED
jgi:DNA helicase-2/ATP-dependent DNA helicase PcrA